MDEIAKLREEKFQLELELRRVKEEAAEVYRDWVDGKMPQEWYAMSDKLLEMILTMERIIQATEARTAMMQREIDATVRILQGGLHDAASEIEDTVATVSVVRS